MNSKKRRGLVLSVWEGPENETRVLVHVVLYYPNTVLCTGSGFYITVRVRIANITLQGSCMRG